MTERKLPDVGVSFLEFQKACGNPGGACRAYFKTEAVMDNGRIIGNRMLPGSYCDCPPPTPAQTNKGEG